MPDAGHCTRCEAVLGRDDIGLYKKLIFRGAEDGFLCKACLAAHFRCSTELLDEKILQFRAVGCLLFTDPEDETPEYASR